MLTRYISRSVSLTTISCATTKPPNDILMICRHLQTHASSYKVPLCVPPIFCVTSSKLSTTRIFRNPWVQWYSNVAISDSESFTSLSSQVQEELHLIHTIITTGPVTQELAELRKQAADLKLWENAGNATSIVQRLASIETRKAQISDSQRQYLDTKELYVLAKEENDQVLIQECVNTMTLLHTNVKQLRFELLLTQKSDSCSCFLELQTGAGGTDSCDWTAILARMYSRWGEARGFQVHSVDESVGEEAGFRSVMLRIDGVNAYGWTKNEAGVHRLVRISPFDNAKRRHTSFSKVRVYPIVTQEGHSNNDMKITMKELRIDTFRSSGPGGQHVNSTDSAIRITHLPTGIVVQSQSERSQHRNKAEAMAMLRAKLYQCKVDEETHARRQFAQGLGDNAWGNQIRSYVLHPYQLVKDHRTNYTENNTTQVLNGDIDRFIEKMLLYQAASMSDVNSGR